ncbi:hypothetical protein [Arthrobacter sp. CP30]
MTAVATKGRELQLSTLPEISTAQVVSFLSQPTNADTSDVLVQLWANSTPEDADNGYSKQARILAAVLDRNVNPFVVSDAMEAVATLHRLQAGDCLVNMYGVPNTDQNRDSWLDHEQQNLTTAVVALGGNR